MNVSSFTLKIVAITGMTCNHIANVFGTQIAESGTTGEIALIAIYSLGGLTFPIMAFLLTEGYEHTSNICKYAQRLFMFALIAQIPYSLLWGAVGNVLFTLLISLGILYANDHCPKRWMFWVVAAGGTALSYLCDWGIIGPVLVYLFAAFKNKRARGIAIAMLVPYAASGLPALLELVAQYSDNLLYGIPLSGEPWYAAWCYAGYAFVGFTLATLMITCYRGRRGRPLKWLFYVYYPLHLMVIWLVNVIAF